MPRQSPPSTVECIRIDRKSGRRFTVTGWRDSRQIKPPFPLRAGARVINVSMLSKQKGLQVLHAPYQRHDTVNLQAVPVRFAGSWIKGSHGVPDGRSSRRSLAGRRFFRARPVAETGAEMQSGRVSCMLGAG